MVTDLGAGIVASQQAWISVVYCGEQQQIMRQVPWFQGITAWQALQATDLLEQFDLALPLTLGVFGLKINAPETHLLQAGDRLEIYRALIMNPKDVRRKRAAAHPVGRVLKGNQWRKKQEK